MQKTKTNKDIGKVYYKKEMKEEGINKINTEIKTFRRAIIERKSKISMMIFLWE